MITDIFFSLGSTESQKVQIQKMADEKVNTNMDMENKEFKL